MNKRVRADIFLDLAPVVQSSNVVKRIVFSLSGILPFAHKKILEVKVMVRLGVDLTKFAEFAIEVFIWVVEMS